MGKDFKTSQRREGKEHDAEGMDGKIKAGVKKRREEWKNGERN